MFGENRPNLETFVFDFSGDLYGTQLSIALIEHLRGEEKFDSLEALITQMDRRQRPSPRHSGRPMTDPIAQPRFGPEVLGKETPVSDERGRMGSLV